MRIPAFTISAIFSSFEPNTTAFGGVATGNINAHEAASVVPTSNRKGFIPIRVAKGIITGKSIAVVAIFEVSSVRKFTPVTISRITINALENEIKVNCSPIQLSNPVA